MLSVTEEARPFNNSFYFISTPTLSSTSPSSFNWTPSSSSLSSSQRIALTHKFLITRTRDIGGKEAHHQSLQRTRSEAQRKVQKKNGSLAVINCSLFHRNRFSSFTRRLALSLSSSSSSIIILRAPYAHLFQDLTIHSDPSSEQPTTTPHTTSNFKSS